MITLQFEAAQKSDARTIARLYSISSDGVADYIWTLLAEKEENILDVGTRRYERENTLFSYQNCRLAKIGDQIVGMMVAFPMEVDPHEEPETDPVLALYSRLEEDQSYYICGVALFEDFRGQGIGSQFMAQAEDNARKLNLEKLSLIVFEENTGARTLYERLGYAERARETVYPHPLIHYTGDALLMVKEL